MAQHIIINYMNDIFQMEILKEIHYEEDETTKIYEMNLKMINFEGNRIKYDNGKKSISG